MLPVPIAVPPKKKTRRVTGRYYFPIIPKIILICKEKHKERKKRKERRKARQKTQQPPGDPGGC